MVSPLSHIYARAQYLLPAIALKPSLSEKLLAPFLIGSCAPSAEFPKMRGQSCSAPLKHLAKGASQEVDVATLCTVS
jgi:hypothetical protein